MSAPDQRRPWPPEIELLRPWQWVKNTAVFAGLVFAGRLFDPAAAVDSLLAFLAFCLLSGVAYAANDIADRAADALHPQKSRRPLPSGRLTVAGAVRAGGAALLGAVGLGVAVGGRLLLALGAYAALQAVYNLGAKRVAGLDVMTLALGFVVRVAAGAWVLRAEVSPWLLVCTLHLALFLALAKRRHEKATLADAAGHRHALRDYDPDLLDQLLTIAAAATIVTYSLYTLAEQTVRKHGSHRLVWTLPLVMLGVFRYVDLVRRRGLGGEPERVLWTDRPLLAIVAGWAAAAASILYLGRM